MGDSRQMSRIGANALHPLQGREARTPNQLSSLWRYSFPALLTVTVRSNMPGSETMGICSAFAKIRCSYTSSEMTVTSCSMHNSAISVNSWRVNTRPVGFCGVFKTRARVLLVNAERSSPGSNVQVGGCNGTYTGSACAITIFGTYES